MEYYINNPPVSFYSITIVARSFKDSTGNRLKIDLNKYPTFYDTQKKIPISHILIHPLPMLEFNDRNQ